jgi:hypothetical protein
MKTFSNNFLQVAIRATFLMSLLIIAACSNEQKKDGTTSTTSDVKTPQVDLHTAVLTDNFEAVKQHIAAGSNLNEKDPFGGSSPLITASLFNKPEMAKLLIDAGADINFQNNDGATALHTAAFFCRPEIVKMLLDNGADKTIKNKFGSTAFESVAGPFADVKNTYDMMGKMLAPMGLKLDYTYIEKTRPQLAVILK